MDNLSRKTRRLFQAMHKQWLPRPQLEQGFLDTLDGYTQLQQHLRKETGLQRLSAEMYPDLDQFIGPDTKEAGRKQGGNPQPSTQSRQTIVSRLSRSELHEVLHIIQTMEIAWLNGQMSEYDSHPLNFGWASVFHRWAVMPSFRKLWPILRTDFSREFVSYCESHFSLRVDYSDLQPLLTANGAASPAVKILRREFEYEWPEVDSWFLTDNQCLVCCVTPSIAMRIEPAKSKQQPFKLSKVPLGFVALISPQAKAAWATGRESQKLKPDPFIPHPNSYELRIWVRPQHRFLGVGRHLMTRLAVVMKGIQDHSLENVIQTHAILRKCRIIEDLKRSVDDGTTTIVTQYLERSALPSRNQIRRQLQLGFLYDYSFRRTTHTEDAAKVGEVTSIVVESTWDDFLYAAQALADDPSDFEEQTAGD
ncbi:MAG: hypothetical protein ACYTGL_13735 [Planctomycetota bacterium]|jgi:hypothetical protein